MRRGVAERHAEVREGRQKGEGGLGGLGGEGGIEGRKERVTNLVAGQGRDEETRFCNICSNLHILVEASSTVCSSLKLRG